VYYVGGMTTGDIGTLILAIIESSMEDTRIPDAIAAYADKRAGKAVTKGPRINKLIDLDGLFL
jgi:hypothetical protein